MNTKLIIIGLLILVVTIVVVSVIKNNTSKFGNLEKETKGYNKVEELKKIRNILEPGLYSVKTIMNRDSNLNEGPSFIADVIILSNNQKLNIYKMSKINHSNFTNSFTNLEIDTDLKFKIDSYDLNNSIVSNRIGNVVEISKDKIVVIFSGTSKTTNIHFKNAKLEFLKNDLGITSKIFDDSNNLVRITNYKKK